MVWFDCECGESLKKPSVAKHLLHKRCSSVTCVDCNTTFFGNEFEAHIKCISEAQKYMGSLYQADSKREGAKQDDWLTAVTKTLNEYQGPLKYLVDRLRQYDNIPRKKKAFENFVANSLNLRRDPATLAKLWALVESCASKGADNSSQTRMTPLEWKSFEQETIEILKRAGGSMTWKLLQANLAKRRKVCFPNEDYDRIRVEVLANIPDNFLSDSSNIVKIRSLWMHNRFEMCHYRTLGIARNAAKDVIRKSYLQLAKKYHPDLNKAPTAHAMFQKIQEAYSVLSDESKKRNYDAGLGGESTSSSSPGGQSRTSDPHYERSAYQRPYNAQRPPRYDEYGGFPGGAQAYWKWKAQMDAQEVEEEYRRARDAQAREFARQRAYGYNQYEFNEAVFRERLLFGLGRILPIFIPILIIMTILRSSVRRSRDALSQVIYDEQGRAYVRDQDGVPHRMREFDLR